MILLALVPPLLYFATMMRTIGLPDSAILIDEMAGPVISSHVNNHNLNNLVGFFFQHLPVRVRYIRQRVGGDRKRHHGGKNQGATGQPECPLTVRPGFMLRARIRWPVNRSGFYALSIQRF